MQVRDHWEMDLSELLSSAEEFKDKGTEFFKVVFLTVQCHCSLYHEMSLKS